jgi:hypothetical protein
LGESDGPDAGADGAVVVGPEDPGQIAAIGEVLGEVFA